QVVQAPIEGRILERRRAHHISVQYHRAIYGKSANLPYDYKRNTGYLSRDRETIP
ncbi:MAG: hypothetical protein RL473_101, partial [Actinomycetota bacterium]